MALDTDPITDPRTETVTFPSGDHRLSGTLFHPETAPGRVVILNGATGVPARFYRHFAAWAAAHLRALVLTYDYRDFGASAHGPARQSKATMADWGVRDAQAARDFVAARSPDLPVWIIGHSLGALCVSFQRDLHRIERMIAVGSGPIHTRDHPWPYRGVVLGFWHGPMALATAALGYMPGRALGFSPDLPRGVFWQWRRWCTSRTFFARDIGNTLPEPDWTGMKAPLKLVAMEDDHMVPPPVVARLADFYRGAEVSQVTLRPSDYGARTLGHINIFAPEARTAWADLLA
ncbi:MAG: alpha/beta fold hydrolase [Silicimonas sp.]|nr:alpha/beta fold hydrolase [Silicimonas sp.]